MAPEHRKNINLNEQSDSEVIWGEISPMCVEQLNNLMEIYSLFILQLEGKEWGVCDEENKKEFLDHTKKFSTEVTEALKLMSPEKELFRLDQDDLAKF